MSQEFDVAVVGYGPVGMATAALLGRLGHRVVVLERYTGLYNLPRAAIFDDEAMRTFAELGISERLLPTLHVQQNYEWRNGDGELLIEHSFATTGKSGWAEWYMMYQPYLEDALNDAARGSGNVQVRFDSAVTGYTQSADSVRIETESGEVSAKYVIASDGGNSFTRRFLEIDQTDLGFSEPWMVCDFELTADALLPMARQVCDPAQPISIISLGPKHHRFSFMLDSEAAFEIDSAPHRVWARVSEYLAPDQAKLIRVATYTFRSLLAHSWRTDRIILAGDAAHQMPPFLGQGMCSGIRDAQNLAMRLDLLLTGKASDGILDSYQSEREPHVEAVIRKGIELGRVQTLRDPAAAAERDRVYLANRAADSKPDKIRFPGIGVGLVSTTPGAGELSPQGVVSPDGRMFDEVFGYGWFLIAQQPVVSDFDNSIDLSTVILDGSVDVDGTYAAWFEQHDATAAVVRPDFYVYGTANSADGLNSLLAELRSQLEPLPVWS